MRIRSITCFFDPNIVEVQLTIAKLSAFSQKLESAFRAAGFEVQTRRLAMPPFPKYTGSMSEEETFRWMENFESEAVSQGFAFVSFGPALPEYPESYTKIPGFLKQSKNAFFSGVIADRFQIYPQAIHAVAGIITQSAGIDPDGFANLQFSALANVRGKTPFFPAAYHVPGEGLAFALAIECADVVLKAFQGQSSLQGARSDLLTTLESAAARMQQVIERTTADDEVHFAGFDFSPAPYPQEGCTLGGGLEAVGQNAVGRDGSLAAAAVIADTLDEGNWKRTGFNGLMLPVLEDGLLAARAAEGVLSVKDLLLYSAVCGTGLDTVPIPGDSSEDEIAAVLFDVAALSVRLGKPLTARLMPIPGKAAGDKTNFTFDYFAPSRVLPLSSGKVGLPLNGDETIPLTPRYLHRQLQQK